MFSTSRVPSNVGFIIPINPHQNDSITAFVTQATKLPVTDLPVRNPDPVDRINIAMEASKSTGMLNTNSRFNCISSNNNVNHDTNPDKSGLDLLNLTIVDQTRHA